MILILFLFWIVLSGKVTLEIILFGLLASCAVFLFLCSFIGWTWRREKNIYKLLPLLIAYIIVLEYEIIKANISVLPFIFGRKKPDGVVVRFDSGLNSPASNAILANSITMTPGTITLQQTDSSFTVHCLHDEMSSGMDSSVFVKLLRRMEAISRGGNK